MRVWDMGDLHVKLYTNLMYIVAAMEMCTMVSMVTH